MTALTQKVIDYQKTGAGLGRLVNQISEMVYRFPASQAGFSDEDGAEMLLRFLPRIQRLIKRYRETGQSFESYLAATLRWQIRSLAAERSGARIQLCALRGPGSELRCREEARVASGALEVRESAATAGSGPPESHPALQASAPAAPRLGKGRGRRLVSLALKMSERLDEADYRRVATATGCDPEWLIGCWQTLRDGCTSQRERRRQLQERRDRAWFQIRCLEYRRQLVLDDNERETVMRRLGMWRRRHQQTLRTLARMHYGPSHADIARAIGVPKGTVDSSIFYGKREIEDPAYRTLLASAIANP